MATLRKITIAVSLAALTFASTASTSPAYAWCHGYCGYHGGWGYHHSGWGPGLAFGLAAGALAAGAAAYSAETSCVVYRPVYDRWGNYAGRQAVNVC